MMNNLIYSWTGNFFFYETYGAIGEDVDVNKWTDGFQDVMGNDDTIPYHLVKSFDQIIPKSIV